LVLIVDDEPAILRLLRLALSDKCELLTAENGEQALKSFADRHPDLILLDVILPDMSGLDVLKEVKAQSDVPVILMTAGRSEAVRIEGLQLGADEFIAKPFVPEHVAGSISFLLARGQGDATRGSLVIAGDVEIDLVHRIVRKAGRIVPLTHSEWTIIESLVLQRGEPRLHQEILSRVWGSEYQNDVEYLSLWIKRLRDKLGDDGDEPKIILPYLDVGYRLNMRPSPL
jgi:DNA-binding response OmpR family regulator